MIFEDEIVVDLFAGGGGASCGIEMGLDQLGIVKHVDVAVNHDAAAIALHEANHPTTKHYHSDVFEVDPVEACAGRPVGLLWASPDCTHFSKAKGSKPLRPENLKSRALAWVVTDWAEKVAPRIIMIENVEEFRDWGPTVCVGTNDEGVEIHKPDPDRKCESFDSWVESLEALGYVVEHREMRACNYGTPTIRKRLFVIAVNDGLPVVWPTPTHAPADEAAALGLEPYLTAADCIDWDTPCASIFLDKEGAVQWALDHGKPRNEAPKRPLAENTLTRVARGVGQYVVENPKPFVVPLTHHGNRWRVELDEPMPTVTAANRGELSLVAPSITKFRTGSTGHLIDEPLHTITGAHATTPGVHSGGASPIGLVEAELTSTVGHVTYAQHGGRNRSAEDPLHTVTASPKDQNQVVQTELVPFIADLAHGEQSKDGTKRWGSGVRSVEEPLNTVVTSGNGAVAEVELTAGYMQRDFGTGIGHGLEQPVNTITAGGGGHCTLVQANLEPCGTTAATMIQTGYGEREGQAPRALDIEAPLGTVVAGGVKHAVVETELAYIAQNNTGLVGRAADRPLSTILKTGSHASLVTASMAKLRGGVDTHHQEPSIEEPLHTVSCGGNHAVIETELQSAHVLTNTTGHTGAGIDEPVPTLTTGEQQALVVANLTHNYTSNTGGGQGDLEQPIKTVTTGNHAALVETVLDSLCFSQETLEKGRRVYAFLTKYYGTAVGQDLFDPTHTVTTNDRLGLVIVTVEGDDFVVTDISLRMLQPKELYRAQGFPEDYVIDRGLFTDDTTGAQVWRKLTRTEQVRMCGNSVCPPNAAALVRANVGMRLPYRAIAA